MLELRKIKFRFQQFGGLRMVKTYAKMGVLHFVIWETVKVLFSKRPLKEAYPVISQRILPILQNQYRPLLKHLAEKYDKQNLQHKKNDVVYSSWIQGMDNAPDLVKVCMVSRKKYIPNKTFVVITNDNIHDYVQFPNYIEEKYKRGIIPYSHATDLLRLELLINYGGTWIDSTVFVTNNNYPKEMLDSDLFLYHFQNNKEEKFSGISNWFISSYSNNKLLLILRDMLYQYWKDYDCLIDYFVFHKFFWMIEEELPEEAASIPLYSSYDALQMALQLDKPYNDTIMNKITSSSSFHKLDYRKNNKTTSTGEKTFYAHIIENYAK